VSNISHSAIANPPCPVTGEPAVALVQTVRCEFLARLWEIEFKVNVRPSFAGASHLSLWRSPTGLLFFSPARAGDAEFYKTFYKTLGPKLFPREDRPRAEFLVAAQYIATEARVLDVGCGFGGFRPSVRHAHYFGIDPHFADGAVDWARSESLAEHLISNAGAYDVVCAFQVIEHVEKPAALFAEMATAAKPGGRVIVGVPHVPSAMTRIPNFLLNAPPHHLTWWSEQALRALAHRQGLIVEEIRHVAWSKLDSIVYWIERCSIVRCRDVYFKHAWAWHFSALTGLAFGYLMDRLFGPPKRVTDEGSGLLLIARKPF
jgi:2-polyprenyl-3-methyl-5-hydroxy-6-metoxy-1,4-benzoquinol methylase